MHPDEADLAERHWTLVAGQASGDESEESGRETKSTYCALQIPLLPEVGERPRLQGASGKSKLHRRTNARTRTHSQ